MTVAGSLSAAGGDDALDRYTRDKLYDNLHLGAEATFLPGSPINFSVRVGNNHGYPTVGAEVKLLVARIGVAYYGDPEADWYTGGMSLNF